MLNLQNAYLYVCVSAWLKQACNALKPLTDLSYMVFNGLLGFP